VRANSRGPEQGKRASAAHKYGQIIVWGASRKELCQESCENTSPWRDPVKTGSRKAQGHLWYQRLAYGVAELTAHMCCTATCGEISRGLHDGKGKAKGHLGAQTFGRKSLQKGFKKHSCVTSENVHHHSCHTVGRAETRFWRNPVSTGFRKFQKLNPRIIRSSNDFDDGVDCFCTGQTAHLHVSARV